MGDGIMRRTIRGRDHWGPYVGRLTHDPNTGRPLLEVLQDDDEVLVQDGSAFVTFWAGQELPRVTPSVFDDLRRGIDANLAEALQHPDLCSCGHPASDHHGSNCNGLTDGDACHCPYLDLPGGDGDGSD